MFSTISTSCKLLAVTLTETALLKKSESFTHFCYYKDKFLLHCTTFSTGNFASILVACSRISVNGCNWTSKQATSRVWERKGGALTEVAWWGSSPFLSKERALFFSLSGNAHHLPAFLIVPTAKSLVCCDSIRVCGQLVLYSPSIWSGSETLNLRRILI